MISNFTCEDVLDKVALGLSFRVEAIVQVLQDYSVVATVRHFRTVDTSAAKLTQNCRYRLRGLFSFNEAFLILN